MIPENKVPVEKLKESNKTLTIKLCRVPVAERAARKPFSQSWTRVRRRMRTSSRAATSVHIHRNWLMHFRTRKLTALPVCVQDPPREVLHIWQVKWGASKAGKKTWESSEVLPCCAALKWVRWNASHILQKLMKKLKNIIKFQIIYITSTGHLVRKHGKPKKILLPNFHFDSSFHLNL